MNEKVKRYFSYLFYFCIVIGAVILNANQTNRFLLLTLYVAFAGILITHHQLCFKRQNKNGNYLLLCLLPLGFAMQCFEHTTFIGFYIMLAIAYTLFACEKSFSLPYALFAIVMHGGLLVYLANNSSSIDYILMFSAFIVPRSLVLILVILVQYCTEVSLEKEELATSLKKKTGELELALSKLSAYADELQSTAELRAREALMDELHNHLGHILTTASIGMQAAIVMMDKHPLEAQTQMIMASKQIQDAMTALRRVISGSVLEQSELDLDYDSLRKLITETERQTGVEIEHNLTDNGNTNYETLELEQRKFLYHALMEGLTNGIRHGSPTKFQFNLSVNHEEVLFRLLNNGCHRKNISDGYGLSRLRTEAARFGGCLEIHEEKDFLLEIRMPAKLSEQMEASL